MTRARVLLVGGHPFVVEMLTEHLRVGNGYELEVVQYCDDALLVLQGRRFDLVLVLSLHMPWPRWHSPARPVVLTNAILFLEHMRTLHDPPAVILVSGSPIAEAEKESLAHGAFAFIRKPFDLEELDRIVVLALENRKGRQ